MCSEGRSESDRLARDMFSHARKRGCPRLVCARLLPPQWYSYLALKGYSSLIRAYVNFILAKLRFHKNHKEFNGMFEYEEYISLKGIDDPNEG